MGFTAAERQMIGEKRPMNKSAHAKPMRKLARIRKGKGFTQGELAYAIGMRPMTVYYYEAGVREPNAKTLRKISTALGVRVDDILED